MPRKPRMEYAGAVYHVMNRGDNGRRIFNDRHDYEIFLTGMREVCERCGWKVHAYVCMPNHFHWLLETPEPNLVQGMKWFLGAYTQRFNTRHGRRGHVFQGRYKALPIEVDSGNYFETVSTYIHLNPARAGLVSKNTESLKQYEWGSYPLYLRSSGKRPEWLEVRRVLENLELPDTVSGRQAYQFFIDGVLNELRRKRGREEYARVWKGVRHGWFLGGEAFRDSLVKHIENLLQSNQRESYSGAGVCRHDEAQAEKLLALAADRLGVSLDEIIKKRKGDDMKCALAWLVHGKTAVSHKWISGALDMGVASNMTQYINRVKVAVSGELARMREKLQNIEIPK